MLIQDRFKRGSPPRMRGKAIAFIQFSSPAGITPAYAGKRFGSSNNYGQSRDHPRVCGEKSVGSQVFQGLRGSPPRMRGKDQVRGANMAAMGITPAYAGKSFSPLQSCAAPQDHPRVCGEKVWRTSSGTCSRGSPPRMRGKVLLRILRVSGMGITPAYAGKSEGCEGQDCSKQDHPRVCGEKHIVGGLLVFLQGSPPRMRGKD